MLHPSTEHVVPDLTYRDAILRRSGLSEEHLAVYRGLDALERVAQRLRAEQPDVSETEIVRLAYKEAFGESSRAELVAFEARVRAATAALNKVTATLGSPEKVSTLPPEPSLSSLSLALVHLQALAQAPFEQAYCTYLAPALARLRPNLAALHRRERTT